MHVVVLLLLSAAPCSSFGTSFMPDTFPDATLPFYQSLWPALRGNTSVSCLALCPGIEPQATAMIRAQNPSVVFKALDP